MNKEKKAFDQKLIEVYSYFSIEKLYSVIIWKIVVDQIPFPELQVLAQQLIDYSDNEVRELGIDVWFSPTDSVVIYAKDNMIHLLCVGQCGKDNNTVDKLKKFGKEIKKFID